jgi:hypothetical protein
MKRPTCFLVLLAIVGGCSESRRSLNTSNDGIATVADRLSHSCAFRKVQRDARYHPRFFVDDETADYWEVAVGDDDVPIGDDVFRFDRWDTVRVYKNGDIKKLDAARDIWLDDYVSDGQRFD